MNDSSALTPTNARTESGRAPVDPQLIARMTRNEADMAFKKRVQTIFDWVMPADDDVILDIPCGRGFYLNMIRYVSKCHLVGAELDGDVIRKAQANVGHLPDIQLNQANIYALPYPDNTFDAVILSEILEHIDDDVAGLREVYRVLKPNGVVAITVPNADYPFWWDPINRTLEFLFKRPIRTGMFAGIWANHVRLYRRDQLRSSVLAAGFQVEEERAFTHDSFPFIHNLVYGIGMPLLESGALPGNMATAANRITFDQNDGSLLNPINLGLKVFNFFDRNNSISEPVGRSTVNLAIKGRKA
jgi:SAM-dependent methyltransferase